MKRPRPFRFGVQLFSASDASEWVDLAREAEDLGYSTLFAPDHFDDQLAPFPALMAAASVTTRLRVGPLVLANDFKHPVVTAKEAATIDLLSNGRLELGMGAGWMTTDYQRSGIAMDPAGERVERLAESIAVVKGLFGEGPFSYSGTHYQIDGLSGTPRPVQQPHPPLLVGGGGPRVLALAAREADIVGVNPNLKSGRVDESAAQDSLATAADRKIDLVRRAAGARYDDLEINFLVFACVVTEDRETTLAAISSGFGLQPEQLSDLPHVWIGAEEQIGDQLIAARERWDASYFVVQGADAMRAAAPVVARLAGS